MTYPRAHLVDPDGGHYHVYSRCVRRAWLCGTDKLTGYNFDHRRQWLEERIILLAEIFAVDLYGYAVMSNHYHIVLSVNPTEANHWSDEEVVDKWLSLSQQNADSKHTEEYQALRKSMLLQDTERLIEIRERLGSLSWFMRFINEPLARLANSEDGCKGRFWEGRFKSQRLLDELAILACMVYVDLNPIRAGLTEEVTAAPNTALKRRVGRQALEEKMRPINQSDKPLPFNYTLTDYIDLVGWTVMAQRSKLYANKPLEMLGMPQPALWFGQYLPKPGHWQRALGSVKALKKYAKDLGQHWIRTTSAQLPN